MSVTGFNRARRSYPAQKKFVTQQSVVVEDTATDSVSKTEVDETPATDTEEVVQRKRTKKSTKTTD